MFFVTAPVLLTSGPFTNSPLHSKRARHCSCPTAEKVSVKGRICVQQVFRLEICDGLVAEFAMFTELNGRKITLHSLEVANYPK